MKEVLLLGSTGSIGRNTLKVLDERSDTHRVSGLSGHANHGLIIEQAMHYGPRAVAVTDNQAYPLVKEALASRDIDVIGGRGALVELIDRLAPDVVLVAVSGAVGLLPSLETVKRGLRLALANKESLVMAGHLLMPLANETGAEILPVDSEHSALFQSLLGGRRAEMKRLFLTASGGPFVDLDAEALSEVRPEDALRHPTWDMGRKITIDSATLMNKALEVIEARWLFDCPVDQIEVIVHRQSILHGMAEFTDGSILAQMGLPDMKVPIQYALTFPRRAPSDRCYFDLDRFATLTFERPDTSRFPGLELGFRAAREGGLTGTVLNAANERAVELFLEGKLSFVDIPKGVAHVLDRLDNTSAPSLDAVLAADRWARKEITAWFSH